MTTLAVKKSHPTPRGHEFKSEATSNTMSESEKIDDENVVTAADDVVEEPASSNDGDSGGPDTDLEGWFLRHKIPYTDGVQISLDDWGVQCVEQLKLLPSDVFLGMYEAEKLVVRETAVSEGDN